jgi:hypothetical protein
MAGGGVSSGPNGGQSGFNPSQFTTSSARPSPGQNFYLSSGGNQPTADRNALLRNALPEDQRASFVPISNQEAMNANLREGIQSQMGNYGNMISIANQAQMSQADIQRAIGAGTDMYTYMNRPNYAQYGPTGQFNQPIYQQRYENYARPATQFDTSSYGTQAVQSPASASGMSRNDINNNINAFYNTNYRDNPAGVSINDALSAMRASGINRDDIQRNAGVNNYGPQMAMPQMNTPFNPYATNSNPAQTPFSYQVPNYGTANQAIVGRSSQMRGTPNVMNTPAVAAKKAEGGIASLMDRNE